MSHPPETRVPLVTGDKILGSMAVGPWDPEAKNKEGKVSSSLSSHQVQP